MLCAFTETLHLLSTVLLVYMCMVVPPLPQTTALKVYPSVHSSLHQGVKTKLKTITDALPPDLQMMTPLPQTFSPDPCPQTIGSLLWLRCIGAGVQRPSGLYHSLLHNYPKSTAVASLYGRLSLTLVMENVRALLSTLRMT